MLYDNFKILYLVTEKWGLSGPSIDSCQMKLLSVRAYNMWEGDIQVSGLH